MHTFMLETASISRDKHDQHKNQKKTMINVLQTHFAHMRVFALANFVDPCVKVFPGSPSVVD